MPFKNQLHVPQLLQNVSVQYKNSEYIHEKLGPTVSVVKDTDYFRVYDRNFKVPETKRAPKGVAREYGFEFSTSSYVLEQHAQKDYVGIDEEENNDQGSLKVDTIESLTDVIMRRKELAAASLFTTTSWSLNVSLAAGSAFSDNTTTSDPVRIYDTAMATILANSGKKANVGFIPFVSFNNVKNHVSILDRVKYTSAEVSEKMVGALIGIDELLVPTAVQDTAAEGLAPSMQNFFAGLSWIGWKGATGLKQPNSIVQFKNNRAPVRMWRDEERNADAIEVEQKFQFKVVASLTGYLIKGI